MDANEYLKQMIGDLMIQVAVLRAEVDSLKKPAAPVPREELTVVPLPEAFAGR